MIDDKDKKYDYFNGFNLDKCNICNLKINTRKKLKNSGIPDLYITFDLVQNDNKKKYLILLEAKLCSDEHDDQCKNYYGEVSKFNEDIKIFIYLTLDGRECSDKHYELIRYQDLINNIYIPLLSMKSNNVVLTVEEYLKCFNAIYDWDYNDIKFYPYTEEMKKGVDSLWNTLQVRKLFDDDSWRKIYNDYPKAFKIFSICLLNSEIVKDKDVINRIKSCIKDMRKYYYKDKPLQITNLFKTIIEELIRIYKIKDINDIDERLIETTKGYLNLIDEEEYVLNNDYYSCCYKNEKEKYVEIGNKKYYYLRFNPNDAENFIESLKDCDYYETLKEEGYRL